MCHVYNEKYKKRKNRGNWTAKSRKNQNPLKKGKLQVFGNTRSRHHQTSGDKRKNKKRVPQTNKKISKK